MFNKFEIEVVLTVKNVLGTNVLGSGSRYRAFEMNFRVTELSYFKLFSFLYH